MKPSAEDLLGYLLGALEPEEHRRVDRELAEQPELQIELMEIRHQLVPLARLEEVEALARETESHKRRARETGGSPDSGFPPAGLARRACEFVSRAARTRNETGANNMGPSSMGPSSMGPSNMGPSNMGNMGPSSMGPNTLAVAGKASESPASRPVISPVMSPVISPVSRELVMRNHWQVQDFIVLAAVLMLAAAILMPALLASRNQARLAACQDNLRRVGMGLFNYSEAHHNRFVPIARTGPLAVAGAYAPVLKAGQYIESDRVVFCTAAVQDGLYEVQEIPSLAVLEKAFRENSQQLAELQSLMGGSYGYTLGHYEQDQYIGPMNLGRSFRVIMSDAPNYGLANRTSANHGGSGLNMLFEDGSVRFSQTASIKASGESIFVNRNGLIAAGTDVHDSVIGASNVSAWISSSLYRH